MITSTTVAIFFAGFIVGIAVSMLMVWLSD